MGFLDSTTSFFNSKGFQSVLSGLETGLGIAQGLDDLFENPPTVTIPGLSTPSYGTQAFFPPGFPTLPKSGEPAGAAPAAAGSTASLLVVLALLALAALLVLKFAG